MNLILNIWSRFVAVTGVSFLPLFGNDFCGSYICHTDVSPLSGHDLWQL
jgi:hypothetical protein